MRAISAEAAKFLEKCRTMSASGLKRYLRRCFWRFAKPGGEEIPMRSTTYDDLIDLLERKLIVEKLYEYAQANNTQAIVVIKRLGVGELRTPNSNQNTGQLKPSKRRQVMILDPEVSTRVIDVFEQWLRGRQGRIETPVQRGLGNLNRQKLLREFNRINDERMPLNEFSARIREASSLRDLVCGATSYQEGRSSLKNVICRALGVKKKVEFKNSDLLAIIKAVDLAGEVNFTNLNEISAALKKAGATPYMCNAINAVRSQLSRKHDVDAAVRLVLQEVMTPVTTLREKKAKMVDRPETLGDDGVGPNLERLPWKLLPPGNIAIAILNAHFRKLEQKTSWRDKVFDVSRLARIENDLRPSYRYIGEDGFEGYVAYSFHRTNCIVLECPVYANATYILKDNWQTISKLTKWEARTAHSKNVVD